MRARPTSRLSSQSGAVTPGLIITLAIVGVGAWILLAAFEADTAHYGSVPVPSDGQRVELGDGEIDVYYSEAIPKDMAASLVPPPDLAFSLVGGDGQTVRVDSRGGEPEETDEGSARVVGAAFPPEEGSYVVTVDSDQVNGRPHPELTFGQSPLQAVADRFDEIVDQLKGPTGIVVAIVIVILLLLPSVRRALRNRRA